MTKRQYERSVNDRSIYDKQKSCLVTRKTYDNSERHCTIMYDLLYTSLVFVLTSATIPIFLLIYLCVKICKSVWLYILASMHPDVEFIQNTTIRTLVDTRRNQGIFTVLARVRGPPRVDLVRRHLQDIINRTDKLGNLAFPKLRKCLVSRWGSYAWKSRDFNLDQVLVVDQRSYRGRPITENNIQDCVSDIVTKYLPVKVPPWQLIVLPTTDDVHYMLLRMHHLLLTDGGVNIADFLPMTAEHVEEHADPTMDRIEKTSPLRNVFEEPKYIPYLYEILTENFTNRWNEFISNYDPLERPELLKTNPGFFEFLAIFLITAVAVVKELMKNHKLINDDAHSRIKYINVTIERERTKRGLFLSTFLRSLLVTFDPRNMFKETVKFWWAQFICVILKVPIFLYYELRAFQSCLSMSYCAYPNTIVSHIYNYVPLCYRAIKEVFYCLNVAFRAPRIIVDELLERRKPGPVVPLCGRKVVAWSPSVGRDKVREVSDLTELSETSILLSALSATLSDYFVEAGLPKPNEVPIIARNIDKNYVYASGPNVRPQNAVGGMLCLRLPTFPKFSDTKFLENLMTIKANLLTARRKQPFVYLMSILQTKHCIMTKTLPSVIVGIILKYLSRKYSVSVTELMANEKNTRRLTSWGQEVTNVIYWRPPQANISISLCLNYYADEVTLAVMADALLSPHHSHIANGLPEHLERIRKAVGL